MAQQEDQERTAGAALTEAKMEGYLEKLAEKGCAPGTLTLYRTNIEKFLQWLNGTPLDPGSATQWRDHLLALGRMPRTVNLQLSPINGLLAHLKLWDYQAPTLLCLEEDAQPELRREEYLRLLAAAKARGNRRVYLAVKVFACLGLNVHELPLLTVEAVASGSVPLADGPPRSLPRCLQRELHPRHGNPRGAGVYHPVGEAHEPHQRHHGHSAPGKKRRRGAGKVQPTLLAEAVSSHAPGLSAASDAAGGAGSQQPGGARAGGCGMVRGAGRPLAWEGKLVNILSQRGGQKRTQQAPGKSWTGCLFRIYSLLWTGWSGPAAAAPLARPKRGGERPSFFSF